MTADGAAWRSIEWTGDGVDILDQALLPDTETILRLTDVDGIVDAIVRLAIRGAPALGVIGGYGVVVAARGNDPVSAPEAFAADVERIRTARPTAVNLARMVDRVVALAPEGRERMLAEAHAVADEEREASRAMGDRGADLVTGLCTDGPVRAMTICNTGGLATVERGTALAVIQTLHERGVLAEALPLETRPLLQGGRLTTWELQRMGAPFRLLVDGAAPSVLARGLADVVLIGADRVAANGDTANKIGSFSLALAAADAGVPFIVVAPESTVDVSTASGDDIEIEDRGPDEVRSARGHRLTPEGIDALNPAFDVTPRRLITALVTETRTVRFDRNESLVAVPPPDRENSP
ncbi:MAG: S-methyl-5-thioribose-1-phosphate isomerase [Actinomycetota bacterium]